MENTKEAQQTEEQNLDDVYPKSDSSSCCRAQKASSKAWKIYVACGYNVQNAAAHCYAWVNTNDYKETLDEYRMGFISEDIYTSIAEYRDKKLEEEQIASIREIYVELPTSERFQSSSESEGVEKILGALKEDNCPVPSLIMYDGRTYTARWKFTEPIDVRYLPLWKRIEEELAKKCFKFKSLSPIIFTNDTSSGYIAHHKDATAILREPGFWNSDTEQEVRVIFATETTYTLTEIAISILRGTEGIREYRKLNEEKCGYEPVTKKRRKAKDASQAETCRPEDISAGIKSHVMKYHQPHRNFTHVYITEKNPEKHNSTDRSVFYSSCLTSLLGNHAETMHTDRDYWMSACEYSIKLYEDSKTITREEGDKIRTCTRTSTTARKKWAELVQMNFVVIDPRKSEISPMPTLERLTELVLERCSQQKLPKPEIVNDGEKLEVKWVWHDVMMRDKTPSKSKFDDKFNPEYDEMQKRLCGIFFDLGVDEKKLQVTTALRVPGTLNTRTNTLVRVTVASEEKVSYKDMMKLLQLTPKTENAAKVSFTPPAPVDTDSLENYSHAHLPKELSDCFVDIMSLHPLNLHPADNDLLYSGYVFVCLENKAQGGSWREWPVHVRDLPVEIMKLKREPDIDSYNVYISQAEFYCTDTNMTPERKTNTISSCRALFIDLDWKLSGHENLTAEEGTAIVLKHCEEHGIPLPSEIVHSGNGCHVKYFLKEAIVTMRDYMRWKKSENILCALYRSIGSDAKATDITRVLRLPGTKNCKPETVDRDVRITYMGRKYDFDNLAALLEGGRTSQTTDGKESASNTPRCESLDVENELEVLPEVSGKWFYVNDRTTRKKERVAEEELSEYLKKQDRSHQLEVSAVRYKGDGTSKRSVDNIYYSYVVLTDCPGTTFDEQIKNIRAHCGKYRVNGMPEPNQIIQDGSRLIAFWRYTKDRSGQELPGYALSRWKVTQEFLCRYFECWGAMKFADTQGYTAMLPLTGFAGASGETVKIVYESLSVSYIFDQVASAVLNFSQAEVKEYLKHKANTKAEKEAEMNRLMEEVLGNKLKVVKSTKFAKTARRIFKDILKLLSLRIKADGSVKEGHRELCVFYALDEAIMAGYVNTVDEFDSLALRLIEYCRGKFDEECGLRTFGTLRRKFANGESVYHFQRRTLMEALDIQEEEQAELEVLRLIRGEKEKPIPKWKQSGKARSTYYRHLKKERDKEVIKADEKRIDVARERLVACDGLGNSKRSETKFVYIMRGVFGVDFLPLLSRFVLWLRIWIVCLVVSRVPCVMGDVESSVVILLCS